MADRETYLEGDEDGDVLVVCTRPSCLVFYVSGGGPWHFTEPVTPYHPTPAEAQAAFDAHLRTHDDAAPR